MAYFARPLIQMARTAAVAAPAARSYSVAVRQPLRAPVMLAAARPVLSPAAFVRAMGGGGGFIDAAEATARIIDVVSNFEKVDSAKVNPDTKFEALDLDSLDVVEVVLAIEEEFAVEIPDAEADKIASIADAVAYISAHPQAK